MALKECKECGKQVSTEAKACPSCGAKPPKQTSIVTWIVLGFIILWVISKIISSFMAPPDKPVATIAAPNLPQAPVTPLTEKEKQDITDRAQKEAKEAIKAEAKKRRSEGVIIGMSKDDVLASNWGKPQSINTTTNARGVREQWVYGNRNYLYFENGVLTTIQN